MKPKLSDFENEKNGLTVKFEENLVYLQVCHLFSLTNILPVM